jgi:hypothetical protein
MTDAAWLAGIVAEAEPPSDVPSGVRAIYLDDYAEALRSVRVVGASDGDNQPVYASLKRMRPGSSQIRLKRYDALEQCDPDVMFSPQEVRTILQSVLERIRAHADEQAEDEEVLEPAEGEEELTIEERPWSAKEIVAQIKILSEAAGTDGARSFPG